MHESAANARILVVDDNHQNLALLSGLLSYAGYGQIKLELDSTRVLGLVASWDPDLIILDLHMPVISGFEILTSLRSAITEEAFLPILVFTADWTEEARKRALDLGAADFITKPFDATEVLLRVRNFLQMREMHVQLKGRNQNLATLVERRTRHVIGARAEALECLARAGEFRDDATGEHARRVADTSARIAEELGLSESTIDLIRTAAPLHDLGKIGINDSVLLKPGRLTFEEFETMKSHTTVGATIIGRVKSPQLRKAREIALNHHENWDGTGYPHGISGPQIPLAARIVAVADTFDALIHERPYKRAWPVLEAIEEVKRLSGSKFDPHVVDAFLKVFESNGPVMF